MALSRAAVLLPMRAMTSGRGPMKVRSCAWQASANVASSERKPYPGWTASQPVIIAALMTAG